MKQRNRRAGVLSAAIGLVFVGCGTSGRSSTHTSAGSSTTAAPVVPATPVGTGAPSSTPVGASPVPSASQPCGLLPTSAGYEHVVWIIMENRGYNDVVGSASAPYLAGVARACGLATNYSGVSHPSLPNYVALTSGSTHGIGNDDGPGSHPLSGPSIFSLLGNRWRSLQERMPIACDRTSAADYAVKHNPAAYYTDLGAACPAQDVALGSPPDVTSSFTLITPNLCHDMHDCSTATGDKWLSSELSQILDSTTYRGGRTAVFVTWDENDSGGSTVPTYVIAPSVPRGSRSAVAFTHYSLLRTTEELLGLEPLLGTAATANSMAAAFNL